MSHIIRLYESTIGGDSLSHGGTSIAEAILFRDCSSESESDVAKLPTSWKCVVLGLPSEISSEVNCMSDTSLSKLRVSSGLWCCCASACDPVSNISVF